MQLHFSNNLLKCPWARHWIPVSCESAAPELTLCSDLPVLQEQIAQSTSITFFFTILITQRKNFMLVHCFPSGGQCCRVNFGTAPLENSRGFIGLFKDTPSTARKRSEPVNLENPFWFYTRRGPFCNNVVFLSHSTIGRAFVNSPNNTQTRCQTALKWAPNPLGKMYVCCLLPSFCL